MKFKISLLAALFTVVLPFAAQAQDTSSYDLNVSCGSGAECSDFDVDFQEDELVAQTRRTRTRRSRSGGSDSKYYVGGNLGVFLPDGDGVDAAFGLNAKVGYNFSKLIAAEVEGLGYFGGTELDDLGYNVLGIAGNAIFTFPLNSDSDNSVYAFIGPGLGFARIGLTGDIADDIDDAGGDTSETGFLFQTKAGVGYPISEKIDIFGQARYLSITSDDTLDSADGFTFDVGATFKL